MLNKNIIQIEDVTDSNQRALLGEIERFFVIVNPFISDSFYYNRGGFYTQPSNFSAEFSKFWNQSRNQTESRRNYLISSLIMKKAFKHWDKFNERAKSAIFMFREKDIISALSGNKIDILAQEPYADFSMFSNKIFADVNSMVRCVLSHIAGYRYELTRAQLSSSNGNHHLKESFDLFLSISRNFDADVIASSISSEESVEVVQNLESLLRGWDIYSYEHSVIAKVRSNLSSVVYMNRQQYISKGEWFNWSIPSSFFMYIEYLINNDDVEWEDTYKKMTGKQSRYGAGNEYYELSLLLLARKDKDKFLKLFPKGVKAKKDKAYKRKCQYKAFISIKEIDKKRVRRMRSDASEEVSLYCLKALFEYKALYTDDEFDEYVVQFNDSHYQIVVNYLMNNLDPKHLLGLVGNPLSDNKYIFKRINEMRKEEEEE